MPWTGKSFAAKHNHALSGAKATKAAAQATAMVKAGVPDGEAIATANARAKGSPKSHADHMARLAKHNTQRDTGKALGRSQSTVSRTLRQGFTREGE